MAIDLGGTVNGDNIRLEPMLAYFGNRNRDCITAVSGLTGGEYFDFETTDFDGVVTEYRAWYDLDNGSVAPSVGGRTLVEINIASGDSASDVASKSVADLALGAPTAAYRSAGAVFVIEQKAMGSLTAAADNDTGFTFETERVGSKKFLGGTQDATEIDFSGGTSVDVKANETGDILIAKLVSSTSAVLSLGLLETTKENYKAMIGEVRGSNYTPVSGSELTGEGEASVGKNLLTSGKELLLKPVNAVDNSRNLTFFRTAPELQNISFSGVDPSVLEVQFTAYLDATKAKEINLWAYGDSFQDVLL